MAGRGHKSQSKMIRQMATERIIKFKDLLNPSIEYTATRYAVNPTTLLKPLTDEEIERENMFDGASEEDDSQ